ncbi:MAG: hypothetical protein JXR49_04150 [Acidobacteria bacterium]|nr:hypothetical protein [Acidobacteriota bacterium]
MTDKLPVKEHLRNAALYRPVTASSPGREWKNQLLLQYSMSRQINRALRTRTGMLKWYVCIGVPFICILLVFAAYFGFINPVDWIESIGSIKDWNIPPIGLKETFIFIAAVNGLTFLIQKRDLIF